MAQRHRPRHEGHGPRPAPPTPPGRNAGGRTLWRVALLAALVAAVAIVLARKPAREVAAGPPPDVGLAASHTVPTPTTNAHVNEHAALVNNAGYTATHLS